MAAKKKSKVVSDLISQFAKNSGLEEKLFNPGATEEEIEKFKSALKIELPDSFYDLYRWHNGSKNSKGLSFPLHDGNTLLSLEEILGTKKAFDDNLRAGSYDSYEKGSWWDEAWVPFLYIEAWYVSVIDTKGSYNTGLKGQIISFDYKSAEDRLIAHDSFDSWVLFITKLLKAGLLRHGFDDQKGRAADDLANDEKIADIHRSISIGFPSRIPIWEYRKKSKDRNMAMGEMVEAINNANLAKVKELIENKAVGVSEVNEYVEDRRTPLHYAIKMKQLDIIKFLIEKGADMSIKDAYGHTPPVQFDVSSLLWVTDSDEHVRIAKLMSEKGGKHDFPLLMQRSIEENDLPMASFCVENGVKADTKMKYESKTMMQLAQEKKADKKLLDLLSKKK